MLKSIVETKWRKSLASQYFWKGSYGSMHFLVGSKESFHVFIPSSLQSPVPLLQIKRFCRGINE